MIGHSGQRHKTKFSVSIEWLEAGGAGRQIAAARLCAITIRDS